MRWWKIVGLAGLAGVAATGAVTVHAERRRRAYTPDEVRARLHQRVAESAAGGPTTASAAASAAASASTADAGADPDPAGADGPAGPAGAGRRRRRWLGALAGRVGRLRGRR